MPVVPTIDASALKKLNAELKELDPALTRQMTKDIKTAVGPFKNAIMSDIPQEAPIRGFRGHSGRTSWGKTKIQVYGQSRKSIARLEVWSTPNNVAMKIIELAGTRNNFSDQRRAHARNTRFGVVQVPAHPTRSGRALVAALKRDQDLSAGGKGGRYAWAAFIKKRGVLIGEVEKILNKFADIAERKLTS